ncbi:hypothetical protein NBRC116495_07210 [Aurantivibrio plasticivorans]
MLPCVTILVLPTYFSLDDIAGTKTLAQIGLGDSEVVIVVFIVDYSSDVQRVFIVLKIVATHFKIGSPLPI